jgi:hypothetical protein
MRAASLHKTELPDPGPSATAPATTLPTGPTSDRMSPGQR